ncbi:hypothetical protein TNCT_100941 [Trichonephila clavata]|uniref:Uncharacterized protein n=1 Tax=Trichonephila clavata TaxID=2740835 RepID=A0A8X6GIH5_TRICU|nr:hypothetical protein TNCT_100941 [Trichonephila clavata]
MQEWLSKLALLWRVTGFQESQTLLLRKGRWYRVLSFFTVTIETKCQETDCGAIEGSNFNYCTVDLIGPRLSAVCDPYYIALDDRSRLIINLHITTTDLGKQLRTGQLLVVPSQFMFSQSYPLLQSRNSQVKNCAKSQFARRVAPSRPYCFWALNMSFTVGIWTVKTVCFQSHI